MKTLSPLFVFIIGFWATTVVYLPTLNAQETSPAASTATASSSQTADTEFGEGVAVELTSVTRGEGDITIKFKYTNNGSKEAVFSQSNYHFANIAALVYYIDPKNKKKYTVIKDADNNPVASPMESIKLEPGTTKAGWCKLPAPPADTANVTVVLPGAPPFEKVKIATQ